MNTMESITKEWRSPVYDTSQRVEIDYRQAAANHCLLTDRGNPATARIEMLRTHLLNQTRTRGWQTVMVTSAQPGEGKTMTAINLAFSMAREYQQTVALVDGDLRRPSIARYLGIQSRPGLAGYFLDDMPLHEVLLWPGIEKLTLIAGDRVVPNSAEVVGSPRMKKLVEEMRDRYKDRYIIYDVPPLLAVADAIAFIGHVDCVLMVVEAGRTTIQDIRKAQALIPEEKLLGMVLNKDTSPCHDYY